MLGKYNDGGDKVKQVKLMSLRRMYELMQMDENQKISDYFSKLIALVNKIKTYGEGIIDQ